MENEKRSVNESGMGTEIVNEMVILRVFGGDAYAGCRAPPCVKIDCQTKKNNDTVFNGSHIVSGINRLHTYGQSTVHVLDWSHW